MNKKQCKEDLKKIGNEALTDLEPVVKKTFNNVFDYVRKVFCEAISDIFKKNRGKNE